MAAHLGLEIILGAFLAGALVGLIDRDSSSHPRFRSKIAAIGYGFLIPVFFISSGVRLDLSGLLGERSALLRVPLFLLALLVVRGVPAVLSVRRIGRSHAVASGLLQATSLPFIATATQIGVAAGLMTPVTAAGLVCAGLLSVMFPAIALGLLSVTLADAAAGTAVHSRPGLRDEGLSADGRFLYAIDADAHRIFGWHVGVEGQLTAVGSRNGLPDSVAGLAAN